MSEEWTGVDALISRLRDDGVKAGQQEAERLLQEAQDQARAIVEQAEKKAEALISEARTQIETEKRASEEALKLTVRDLQQSLKTQFQHNFKAQVRRLVAQELEEPELLRSMLVAIAGRSRPPQDQELRLLLPGEVMEFEDLRRDPEEMKEGPATRLTVSAVKKMLRKGVDIQVGGLRGQGFRVQLVGEDVEMDLSEERLADLLLAHMQPRLRALMEGYV